MAVSARWPASFARHTRGPRRDCALARRLCNALPRAGPDSSRDTVPGGLGVCRPVAQYPAAAGVAGGLCGAALEPGCAVVAGDVRRGPTCTAAG